MVRPIALVASLLAIIGCGGPSEPVIPATPVAFAVVSHDLLHGKGIANVAEFLSESRERLAKRSADMEAKLVTLEQMRQEGKAPFHLLPDARFPFATPIFGQATMSAKHGISIPDYLKETTRDPAIAWHLAVHGDLEAAAKFGDVAALEKHRLDRNYPLEWVRLVALHLQHAEYRAAGDEKDGVAELIGMQRQLRELLPKAARKSPLGQTLLTRGLATLKEAAKTYRERDRADLALQIEPFLASLESPTWSPGLPELASEAWLPSAGTVHVVEVKPAARLLDLLALDLPHEGIDGAFVLLDRERNPAEVILTYAPMQAQLHTPDQFALRWKERGVGEVTHASPDLRRTTYRFGTARLHLAMTPTHARVSAIARVRYRDPTASPLPRDFGPVHLDGGFEQSRRLLAWKQRAAIVSTDDPATLDALRHPFATLAISKLELERDPNHDLIRSAAVTLAEKPNQPTTLREVIGPGLLAYGVPEIEFPKGSRSVHFVWADAETKLSLRVPLGKHEALRFEMSSVSADLGKRKETAQARDDAERKARLAMGKSLSRVPREHDGFRLGMTKDEFVAALPRSPRMHVRELPAGIVASFVGDAKPGETTLRQWVARFDERGKTVELRLRYDGVGRTAESLHAKLGPAEVSPADHAVWNDLPKARLDQRLTWHDDVTLAIVTLGPVTEVMLRDCPAPYPAGVPLPPLAHLPRGVGAVRLGMSLAELQKLGGAKLDDGYHLATEDPNYDALLVWFAGDQAIRIVARHRVEGADLATPERASRAILAAWSRDAATLGWPWRQDQHGPHLQSWSALDDVSRVRVFWQDQEDARRLFTEWKSR